MTTQSHRMYIRPDQAEYVNTLPHFSSLIRRFIDILMIAESDPSAVLDRMEKVEW